MATTNFYTNCALESIEMLQILDIMWKEAVHYIGVRILVELEPRERYAAVKFIKKNTMFINKTFTNTRSKEVKLQDFLSK